MRAELETTGDIALSTGRRAWTVGVMCTAVGLVIAMVTIVNAALPALAADTGATQPEQTWIVDVYTLVLAALVLPAGALGDRYGRRGVLVAGLLVFAVGCAAPVFLDTSTWLIVARAVTGFGAAMIMPATLSIITASFPAQRRGRAIGIWAAVAGVGGLGGLVLAGVLLQHFSWHSVFLGPAVLSIVLVAASLTVPTSRGSAGFDVLGAVLSALAIGAVVYGILRVADLGWGSGVVLGSIAGGLVLGALFVGYELRRASPLLDVRLFGNAAFAAGSVSVTVQFTAAFGMFYALAQYLQLVQGYSALKSGLALWPVAVSLFPLSLASAPLVRRFGLRAVTCVGLAVIVAGMVLIGQLDAGSGYVALAIAVCVLGAGIGVTAPAATSAILDNVPPAQYGVASAVNDATREVGAALGIALVGSVLSAAYTDSVRSATASLPPQAREAAEGSLAGALAVDAHLAPAARAAFAHGMGISMLALAAVVVAGILATAVLVRR
ncbi:drug resistance transporter, EmrB/QacA subfamily [Amycolatopsis pretoriensis]|uniref:Drug resistance transporter, EmrB/QacA subfamily n=1 Tax=Amycolatopsis pretoriensis TaxID=218821 RepID=A0A1H5RGN7_9PSEU|nr:MFS transporter [Amycolatopsis pretoriensis]SEF37535.1 drug resistance transporter, EmrB/QacA subfamily [Amycolatopsis pretoriensis]